MEPLVRVLFLRDEIKKVHFKTNKFVFLVCGLEIKVTYRFPYRDAKY